MAVYPIGQSNWRLTCERFVALGTHWMLDMVVKQCRAELSNGSNRVGYWLLMATYVHDFAVEQCTLALADSRHQFPESFSVHSILPPFHWWLNHAIGLQLDDGLCSSLMQTMETTFTCTLNLLVTVTGNQSNRCVQQFDQFAIEYGIFRCKITTNIQMP